MSGLTPEQRDSLSWQLRAFTEYHRQAVDEIAPMIARWLDEVTAEQRERLNGGYEDDWSTPQRTNPPATPRRDDGRIG